MVLTDTEIAVFIQQYFFPFTRIGMMFMVMPVIGSRIVSPRVRLTLAFLVSLIIVPLLPPIERVPSLSLSSLLFVVQEIAVGLIVGFSFQVVFQVFVLSGQFMAMKMGLGFASMNDPTNGVQTTVLSTFFLMLVTLVFVTMNGHLLLIDFIIQTFYLFPSGEWSLTADMFYKVANMGGWMFSAALLFALPILTSLLLVNVAFGIMSRAAPQLNIFAVGFPFTLLCGIALIWIGLSNFLTSFDNVVAHGFTLLHEIFRES